MFALFCIILCLGIFALRKCELWFQFICLTVKGLLIIFVEELWHYAEWYCLQMVASFHNNSKFLIRALMMISRAHERISLDIDMFLAGYISFMLRIFPIKGFSAFCHSLLSNLYNIGSNVKYPMSANHMEHMKFCMKFRFKHFWV